MRARVGLTAFLAIVPSVVAAQSTTADGVRALVEGDYATAVRILRPLAEQTATPDPIAQFFLAILYDSGSGVRQDPIRACGLYLRSATTANPFGREALQFAEWTREQGFVNRASCDVARTLPWGSPTPVTFSLANDQWVRIDADSLTVGYRGSQKTAPMSIGGPGWVYFPMRHTRFERSGDPLVRHFIEFFVWIPKSSTPRILTGDVPWTLLWMPFEVAGSDVNLVWAGPPLAVSDAESLPPVRVHDLARLRMNAKGEIEWVIDGANPQRGIIRPVDRR